MKRETGKTVSKENENIVIMFGYETISESKQVIDILNNFFINIAQDLGTNIEISLFDKLRINSSGSYPTFFLSPTDYPITIFV